MLLPPVILLYTYLDWCAIKVWNQILKKISLIGSFYHGEISSGWLEVCCFHTISRGLPGRSVRLLRLTSLGILISLMIFCCKIGCQENWGHFAYASISEHERDKFYVTTSLSSAVASLRLWALFKKLFYCGLSGQTPQARGRLKSKTREKSRVPTTFSNIMNYLHLYSYCNSVLVHVLCS